MGPRTKDISSRSPPAAARLIALLCLAAACSKGPGDAARTRPPPLVAVARVTVRDVEETVRAPVKEEEEIVHAPA